MTADHAIAATLCTHDGSMTVAELAAAFGQPEAWVREQVATLEGNGRAVLHEDIVTLHGDGEVE